jgi:hypothetical protein
VNFDSLFPWNDTFLNRWASYLNGFGLAVSFCGPSWNFIALTVRGFQTVKEAP